ncbi:MAG: aspartyl-phosphate phosphatase Spo0E family protein [Negativicutes bacterium]|nr:aspartyl-phosphate phosphatase Spo0E family protein [Negativicutes bacterium]
MIEVLRQNLYRAALQYGLNRPEVLQASRALDDALNEYERLKNACSCQAI